MKEKSIIKYQIFNSIFVSILGVILHFTYEWSNNNKYVGLFSATNESPWEHLKLLFFPMLIATIIGYFYIGKNNKKYLSAKTWGILASLIFTIVFFYTYTGVLGKNIAILDIGSFFIAVLISEIVFNKIITGKLKIYTDNKWAIITLILLFICFIVFTYHPLNIGLFKEYVIPKNVEK